MRTLNEIVAEQIRKHREAKGWRKVDLLRKLCMGDHAAHVWQWEAGTQLPGAYYLCALADVFGCSVDELLGRK